MADQCGGYHDCGFTAECYDVVPACRARRDVSFFVGLAKECGGPVLELGCGTGRVLIPTARAGIRITGLDLSPEMLAVCRQRLLKEGMDARARAQLVAGDIRSFRVGGKFKLVTAPFRPFQHLLTVKDQLACLECAAGHLERGGRLVLDLFNPDLSALLDESRREEFGREPEFEMPDGRSVARCARTAAVDLHNQIIDGEIIYYVTHPDGRKERLVHAFKIRYLFRFEAEHLLTRAGFDLEAVYADYDRGPYGSKYPGELICVARKP